MPQQATLIVQRPGAERQQIELGDADVRIGRTEACEVSLESQFVSRAHARIALSDRGYVLIDEGSRNGTFVNGRQVSGEHLLASGDEVTIGEFRITFTDGSETFEQTMIMPALKGSPIVCDGSRRQVSLHGQPLELGLSHQEYDLLDVLCARYGRVATRDELAIAIWGKGNYEYNMLHQLVHRLKQKLEPYAPGAIVSVPGVGYRLEVLAAGVEPAPEPADAGEFADSPHDTAVILFADIVDSTALTERMGDAGFRGRSRELDLAMREVIRAEGGRPIEGKLLGDGVLAVFTSARQAIQAAIRCRDAGSDIGLALHLGIHAGDVLREADNVYGGAVNIAARVAALSAPGEVLVSDIVRGLARTSAQAVFEDRGEHPLKGLAERIRIYAVV